MKPTFSVAPVPVIPAPRGTVAARKAIGMETLLEREGPLFPVEGGFIGWGRNSKFAVISGDGSVRPLGIDYADLPGYGGALASSISPDRSRMLIKDQKRAAVLTFADGERRRFGSDCCGAAWLDDERAAIADGKALSIVRVADGSVLAERPLGEVTGLGARADGVVVAAFGDVLKPKTRAIEVFRLTGDALEAVGRRTKVPFSYVVPFEGRLYLVEKASFGNWVKCFLVEVDAGAVATKTEKPAVAATWADRRIARVSIGRRRDDAKLSEALGGFPDKIRKKYKLDQLLDCTVDDDGRIGFTLDAGGGQKTTADAILELLQLDEVRALPHLSLAIDARGGLPSALVRELPANGKGFATLTGIDVSSAQKFAGSLTSLLSRPTASSLERLVLRDLGLHELDLVTLESLESLDLEDNRLGSALPRMPALKRLRLRNALYEPMADELVRASWVPQLVELRLGHSERAYSMLPTSSVVALAARGLGALVELGLSGQTQVGDEGAEAIAGAAPRLAIALFAGTGIGARGVQALLRSCPSLRELEANGDAAAAHGLAKGGAALERLRLTVDDAGAAALARNASLGAVRRLFMIGGKLGPAGIRALGASPLFDGLTDLSVDGISIGGWNTPSAPDHLGDDGATALAEMPGLKGLTRLRIERSTIGKAGAMALAASPHLAKLEVLNVNWNPTSPAALVKLMESLPSLKKLTAQLADKSELERLREVSHRRGIELELFTGLYKL